MTTTDMPVDPKARQPASVVTSALTFSGLTEAEARESTGALQEGIARSIGEGCSAADVTILDITASGRRLRAEGAPAKLIVGFEVAVPEGLEAERVKDAVASPEFKAAALPNIRVAAAKAGRPQLLEAV